MINEKDSLKLNTPALFSWGAILNYLNREHNEVMFEVIDDKVRRAFRVGSDTYLCEISYNETKQLIEITVLNEQSWTEKSMSEIVAFITDWFDLNTDLEPFYRLAETDTILKDLTTKFTGLRMVGMPNFYEAITWGIFGQQINLGYTYTLKRRFTEKYGESLLFEGKTYWIYPTAEKIASVSIAELLELKLTLRKAEYLIDISQKIVVGKISKAYYYNFQNNDAAEKAMTKIRGIGPWTANYVLMRCLRMGDAFPMADIGLLNGIKVIENLESKPDEIHMKILKERWGPWCSYATFYIWRLLY